MNIRETIENYQEYLKKSEPLFLLIGVITGFFAFIFTKNPNFKSLVDQIFLIIIESLLLLATFILLVILTVWTFIQAKEKKNTLIAFTFLFLIFLSLFYMIFIYLLHPIVFFAASSVWMLFGYLIGDILFTLKSEAIIRFKKWYFHSILNITLIYLLVNLIKSFVQGAPDLNEIKEINNEFLIYYGFGAFLALMLLLLVDTFVSVFNKSRGIGIINNSDHKRFLTRRLINFSQSIYKQIKNI